eukprot:scaffold5321_cov366-Prasinococcus_capsulatus_cf.AAC.15
MPTLGTRSAAQRGAARRRLRALRPIKIPCSTHCHAPGERATAAATSTMHAAVATYLPASRGNRWRASRAAARGAPRPRPPASPAAGPRLPCSPARRRRLTSASLGRPMLPAAWNAPNAPACCFYSYHYHARCASCGCSWYCRRHCHCGFRRAFPENGPWTPTWRPPAPRPAPSAARGVRGSSSGRQRGSSGTGGGRRAHPGSDPTAASARRTCPRGRRTRRAPDAILTAARLGRPAERHPRGTPREACARRLPRARLSAQGRDAIQMPPTAAAAAAAASSSSPSPPPPPPPPPPSSSSSLSSPSAPRTTPRLLPLPIAASPCARQRRRGPPCPVVEIPGT